MEKKAESRGAPSSVFGKRSVSDSRVIPAPQSSTPKPEQGNMHNGEDLDIPAFLRKKK